MNVLSDQPQTPTNFLILKWQMISDSYCDFSQSVGCVQGAHSHTSSYYEIASDERMMIMISNILGSLSVVSRGSTGPQSDINHEIATDEQTQPNNSHN